MNIATLKEKKARIQGGHGLFNKEEQDTETGHRDKLT